MGMVSCLDSDRLGVKKAPLSQQMVVHPEFALRLLIRFRFRIGERRYDLSEFWNLQRFFRHDAEIVRCRKMFWMVISMRIAELGVFTTDPLQIDIHFFDEIGNRLGKSLSQNIAGII